MSNDPNEDRKIIIDEDWKSQVEQERKQIETGDSAPADEAASAAPGPDQIPEASFALLVTTLATQAMAAMGQIPDPTQGQPVIHLGLARHYVDTLAVLEEKTKGNLDEEEAAMLEQVLPLRMLFVAVAPGADEIRRRCRTQPGESGIEGSRERSVGPNADEPYSLVYAANGL